MLPFEHLVLPQKNNISNMTFGWYPSHSGCIEAEGFGPKLRLGPSGTEAGLVAALQIAVPVVDVVVIEQG